MQKLTITMIHDLVCSWCPIGYSNLKTAINNLNLEVDFHFLPFELNPDMGPQGESISSYFNRQFDWNEGQLLDYQTSLIKTAADAGVVIDFSKRKSYFNTHNGHLLMHWAEGANKQVELNEAFIQAYFEQGLDIGNSETLLDIATQVGLDREAARGIFTSAQLNSELAHKMTRPKALKVSRIPAFVLNQDTLISGSQSVAYFEQILTPYIDEANRR